MSALTLINRMREDMQLRGLAARSQKSYLVPVQALSVRFRARFLARLRSALPDVVIPATVWTQPWVVYCKPNVHGTEAVLRYLARYVHRVAITDARLVAVTGTDGGQVTFRYKDRRGSSTGEWRMMTLSAGRVSPPLSSAQCYRAAFTRSATTAYGNRRRRCFALAFS